jgi:hypothetical protein
MSGNQWLYAQIKQNFQVEVSPDCDTIIKVVIGDEVVSIYTPTPDEYIVNVDVVEKAAKLGAKIISYASTWCGKTMEAEEYAKQIGITIMPHGGLFAFLKRKGIQEKS